MPESSLEAVAKYLAKLYLKARRVLGLGLGLVTPAVKTLLATKRRKSVAIFLAAVLVLGGVGTVTGVSFAKEAASAEAEAAAAARAEEAAAKKAAEELADEQTTTRDVLDTSATFAAAARDYADGTELGVLEGALRTARVLLSTGTADELYDARLEIRTAVAAIGERPVPYSWSVTCTDAAYKTVPFETYSAVWASTDVFTRCDGGTIEGDFLSDSQNTVLASGAIISQDKLAGLYGLCADLGFSSYGALSTFSESQITELEAALTLCPDQPAAGPLAGKIAASRQAASDAAAGITFGAGVRRVGESVQAGTYVSEGNIKNCYWERTASDGGIIDNFVTLGALRVEVTIRDSDFSFNSTGCGTWHRQ